MIDLVFFLLLTAIAVLLLMLPYLRREAAPSREHFDLAVHQDQLAELDRDLERGVIDAEAARAAKLEIQRRMITLSDQHEAAETAVHQGRYGWMLTTILVIVVPLASALVYLELGRPHLRDVPLATRILPEQQDPGRESLLADIRALQERVNEAPEDFALWTELARAQLGAGLYGDAAGSYTKAVEITGGNAMLRVELGEALVQGSEGMVTPAAAEQFQAARESMPNEPRSHYYLGLASAQEGDVDAAVESWRHLLDISPSDAPFRAQIISSIRSLLESNGRPADDVIAGLPEGTTATGGAMPAHDGAQNEQIRAMVDGLAARLENEPDNLQGWLMLGRSRLVLQEPELARDAFAHAKELAPDDPEVLVGYASSLLEPSGTPGGDPIVGADAVEIYERLVTLTPDDPEPRWLLGLAAAQAGDKEGAIGHWRDLLGLIAEGSGDRTIVEQRIAALEGDEPAAALAAGAPSLVPAALNGQAKGETANGSGPMPTAEDQAAMAALSPDERQERIRGMVDSLAARLEDDPSDIEGWLRLAQSRTVLDEPEAAKEAYRRALEQAPDNTDVLRAYAASLLGATHPETEAASVTEDALDLYEKIIAIDPDDPEAHWYLGLASVQDGAIDDAKTHWQRVLDILGPDHPNYAAVQSSLEQVETKTQ
jgi:cytochrome c-type biogenesis protein CcmH